MMMQGQSGSGLDVSRETLGKLEQYYELLQKWNQKINLVSKGSLDDGWNRHIVDSIQIFTASQHAEGHWVDIGSGGGLPGIVVAIMRSELGLGPVTLIESDSRKAAFLMTVIRELSLNAKVIVARIEQAPAQSAAVLSARALASLDLLLGFAARHLAPTGLCVFPKGRSFEAEIDAARQNWLFDCEVVPSVTEADGAILKVGNIRHV